MKTHFQSGLSFIKSISSVSKSGAIPALCLQGEITIISCVVALTEGKSEER